MRERAAFDDLIASCCKDSKYLETFFSYYTIIKPIRSAFRHGIDIERISCYDIVLLEPWEIVRRYGSMPGIVKRWPAVRAEESVGVGAPL